MSFEGVHQGTLSFKGFKVLFGLRYKADLDLTWSHGDTRPGAIKDSSWQTQRTWILNEGGRRGQSAIEPHARPSYGPTILDVDCFEDTGPACMTMVFRASKLPHRTYGPFGF